MSPAEKKLYAIVHTAIKDVIRKEIKLLEGRLVDNMKKIIAESNSKIIQREPQGIAEAKATVAQAISLHNGPIEVRPKKNYVKNPVLNDIFNTVNPISGEASPGSMAGAVDINQYGDGENMPTPVDLGKIDTGNPVMDGAIKAPYKDYRAFMKKVLEKDKNRKS